MNERMEKLAHDAVTLEYASAEQIAAENEFCALALSQLSDMRRGLFERYCLKATTAELIAWLTEALKRDETEAILRERVKARRAQS